MTSFDCDHLKFPFSQHLQISIPAYIRSREPHSVTCGNPRFGNTHPPHTQTPKFSKAPYRKSGCQSSPSAHNSTPGNWGRVWGREKQGEGMQASQPSFLYQNTASRHHLTKPQYPTITLRCRGICVLEAASFDLAIQQLCLQLVKFHQHASQLPSLTPSSIPRQLTTTSSTTSPSPSQTATQQSSGTGRYSASRGSGKNNPLIPLQLLFYSRCPSSNAPIYKIYDCKMHKVKIAWLGTGNSVGFEVFEFIDPPHQPVPDFEYNRSGFFHIAVTAPDVEIACKRAVEAGGKQVGETVDMGGGERALYLSDPWGNVHFGIVYNCMASQIPNSNMFKNEKMFKNGKIVSDGRKVMVSRLMR
ncbi:uncharacterized protein BDR25DRAFT_394690 [Lindgomyces ingoldianus]|uniref:Uncharacterized protein n=1 Tax=Lindgomyces ingoldianus TaxID=673940 RepID=A0ACB6QPI3_9PLEO|nr:uncharacterized protein BDR25DRAFT_394690 [Lindgomyces ingoldianus]KAF2468929.1 hypothetical protein BDR25DRAFT_394690 [Lindgomyces ingoldianus]